jgi:hypothetical protein
MHLWKGSIPWGAKAVTSSSFASLSAPFAKSLPMKRSWPSHAAQWRAVLPPCGEAGEGATAGEISLKARVTKGFGEGV